MNDTFKIIIPAQLEKAKNGEWKVHGLASTDNIDKQGESIIQKGIDMSPVDEGRGLLNWDHDNSPENIIGVLDGYKQTDNGLYVNGRLFQNHTRAKAVREIMCSLSKGDNGRMGMSVEGKILERDPKDRNVIKKCQIKAVALTMNPVNSDTHCDIAKSLNSADVEFDADGKEKSELSEKPTYTIDQLMAIVEKALGISGGYKDNVPGDLQDGDALSIESLDADGNKPGKDKKKKKDEPIKKSLRRLKKSEYQYNMKEMLGTLQTLYPQYSRMHIWECVKDRLNTNYPDINDLI